jgi:hypothetical protein
MMEASVHEKAHSTYRDLLVLTIAPSSRRAYSGTTDDILFLDQSPRDLVFTARLHIAKAHKSPSYMSHHYQ